MKIDGQHSLHLAKQAKALGISRGGLYYFSHLVPAADLAFQRRELPAEG
jgi:putative transposase